MKDFEKIKQEVYKAYKDYKKEKTMNFLKKKYSWLIVVFIMSIIMIPVAIVVLLYYELEGKKVGLYYTGLCNEYRQIINERFLTKYKEIIEKEKYDSSYFMKYYYCKKYDFNILNLIENKDYETIFKMINDGGYFEGDVYSYLGNASKNYDIFNLYLEIDYIIENDQLPLLDNKKINNLKEKLLSMDQEHKKVFFMFKYGELKYNRIINI